MATKSKTIKIFNCLDELNASKENEDASFCGDNSINSIEVKEILSKEHTFESSSSSFSITYLKNNETKKMPQNKTNQNNQEQKQHQQQNDANSSIDYKQKYFELKKSKLRA